MADNQYIPYSYHTFMYPFSFGATSESEAQNIAESFIGSIKDAGWKSEAFQNVREGDAEKYPGQDGDQYNLYQYFFPNARALLLNQTESGYKKGEDRRYIYKADAIKHGDAKFEITFEGSKTNRSVSLKINFIKVLIISELKIGLLSIECEYDGLQLPFWKGDCEYDEITDPLAAVNLINDYGRRLYSPIYMDQNQTNPICPEKIVIEIPGGAGQVQYSFSEHPQLSSESGKNVEPALIRQLLFGAGDKNKQAPHRITLQTVLDDRMFVACQIVDNHLSKRIKAVRFEADRVQIAAEDKTLDEVLYKVTFCESSLSCQDEQLRAQKLLEHVYRRWKDYGTIQGVSEYALTSVTGWDDEKEEEEEKNKETLQKSVIKPFLLHYIEMAKMALIQRAAITMLENEATKISRKLKGSGEDRKELSQWVKDVRGLWERYVTFQNELYIEEVTFQEQGVELYAMLKKFLKLKELNQYLDEELNNIHDLAELINSEKRTEAETKLSNAVNYLGVAGLVLAFFSMAQDFWFGAITLKNQRGESGYTDLFGFLKLDSYELSVGAVFLVGFLVLGLIIFLYMVMLRAFMKERNGKSSALKIIGGGFLALLAIALGIGILYVLMKMGLAWIMVTGS